MIDLWTLLNENSIQGLVTISKNEKIRRIDVVINNQVTFNDIIDRLVNLRNSEEEIADQQARIWKGLYRRLVEQGTFLKSDYVKSVEKEKRITAKKNKIFGGLSGDLKNAGTKALNDAGYKDKEEYANVQSLKFNGSDHRKLFILFSAGSNRIEAIKYVSNTLSKMGILDLEDIYKLQRWKYICRNSIKQAKKTISKILRLFRLSKEHIEKEERRRKHYKMLKDI